MDLQTPPIASAMTNPKKGEEEAADETKLEVVVSSDPKIAAWEKSVWEAGRDVCGNCGSDDRVRVRMVVPVEAGGQLVEGNGILLCRACDLTMDLTARYIEPMQRKHAVNFWVSKALFSRLHNGSEKTSFRSAGALIRFLMTKYVSDPKRFDDLNQYQEVGTDVKVNVWVEDDIYSRFKELVKHNGLTVTSALKGLIGMFEAEASVLFEK